MTATRLRIALWVLVTGLCLFGLVMIASVTGSMGGDEGFNTGFIARQAIAVLVGLGGAFCMSWFATDWVQSGRKVLLIALATLGLLFLVPIFGHEVNGARRWFDLGPIKLQPSELAKLAIIITAAWYYADGVKEKIKLHWHGVFVPLAFFLVYALLIYRTRDLGSIVVMAGMLWAMIFFAGARWFYVTVVGSLLIPLAAYLAVFSEAYRRERLVAFMDPWNSSSPAAYHLKQSIIAIGSGGPDGQGLGQGLVRGQWLPERHTDFIYAVICQEFGFVGAIGVAATFLALVAVGLLVANATKDRYQRLLAVGATMMLGIQAFWNMAVVTGLVPTKGLTLPFISYGGSSMVVCLVAVGMLDAVARQARNPLELRSAAPQRVGAITTRVIRRKEAVN
jgi:cell division protein FtsW